MKIKKIGKLAIESQFLIGKVEPNFKICQATKP